MATPPLPTQTPEIWRRIPRWPGYEASDRGQVRSVRRRLTDGRICGGTILAQRKDRYGYWCVSLKRGKRRRTARVHVLVLEAHAGPCPPGMEGCHEGDNKDDNRLIRLRWDTHAANEAEKVQNGRKDERGERNGHARLTEADVREVRDLAGAGVSRRLLASRYEVSLGTIDSIVQRKRWAHVS